MDHSVNAPLRDDVRLLGDLLGECLRQQAGDAMYETVEKIRQASVATRTGGGESLASLRDLLSPLDDATLLESDQQVHCPPSRRCAGQPRSKRG